MVTDERRCAMADHCRGWVLGPEGKRVAARIDKPVGLCDPCMDWVARVVGRLPIGWLKLELTLGEHRAPQQEQTRKPKPGSRIPINVTTDALMRDIEGVLWRARVAAGEVMAMDKPRQHLQYANSNPQMFRRVKAYASVVGPNVDKLLVHEDGMECVRRLVNLERQIVRHVGETAQRERKHLPCPQCKAVALVKEVQDNRAHEYHSEDTGSSTPEVIRCTNCEGQWTEAEYTWLSTIVLSEREEMDMYAWLLAEARWERDVHAWLAAEREWVLGRLSVDLCIDDAPTLIEHVRHLAGVGNG